MLFSIKIRFGIMSLNPGEAKWRLKKKINRYEISVYNEL